MRSADRRRRGRAGRSAAGCAARARAALARQSGAQTSQDRREGRPSGGDQRRSQRGGGPRGLVALLSVRAVLSRRRRGRVRREDPSSSGRSSCRSSISNCRCTPFSPSSDPVRRRARFLSYRQREVVPSSAAHQIELDKQLHKARGSAGWRLGVPSGGNCPARPSSSFWLDHQICAGARSVGF